MEEISRKPFSHRPIKRNNLIIFEHGHIRNRIVYSNNSGNNHIRNQRHQTHHKMQELKTLLLAQKETISKSLEVANKKSFDAKVEKDKLTKMLKQVEKSLSEISEDAK